MEIYLNFTDYGLMDLWTILFLLCKKYKSPEGRSQKFLFQQTNLNIVLYVLWVIISIAVLKVFMFFLQRSSIKTH